MVDTVTNTTLLDGPTRVIVRCMSESDGTGESDAIKIALSALETNPIYGTPNRLSVESIEYDVTGYNYVLLEFDRGTDVSVCVLKGAGYFEFPGGIEDTGSGGTGDLVLTTDGNADGNGYTLVINAKKKYP